MFTKLFTKYVHTDWSERKKQQRSSVFEWVHERLYPTIEEHVNIDQLLTIDLLPELPRPTKVDFVGQNDRAVIGQIIDFSIKNSFIVDGYINRLYSIDKAFEAKGYKNSKYFIIGQEPAQSLKDQHQFWKHVRQLSLFEVVSTEETDRINEYMDEHDVKPLIPDEPTQLELVA